MLQEKTSVSRTMVSAATMEFSFTPYEMCIFYPEINGTVICTYIYVYIYAAK